VTPPVNCRGTPSPTLEQSGMECPLYDPSPTLPYGLYGSERLVDAESRLAERMEEREQERRNAKQGAKGSRS